MISGIDLQKLTRYRLADAKALYQKKRYFASIYMCGYAVELALKRKICHMYNFSQGFPEDRNEFQSYAQLTSGPAVSTINNIREIRNHDLNKLLFFSGHEYPIRNTLFAEWSLVEDWDPEMRYKIEIKRRITTQKILSSAAAIINALS